MLNFNKYKNILAIIDKCNKLLYSKCMNTKPCETIIKNNNEIDDHDQFIDFNRSENNNSTADSLRPKIAQSQNNVRIVSVETNKPIIRIAISFQAGCRYENYENIGVTHFIRRSAGLKSAIGTNFAIMRHIQQLGGNIYCKCDRELISYVVTSTKDNLLNSLCGLKQAATEPLFKPWEIEDIKSNVLADWSLASADRKTFELLHRVAFRHGLGNSLFCPTHKIAELNDEILHNFYKTNFTVNRCSMIGFGISEENLLQFSNGIEFPTSLSKNPDDTSDWALPISKYYGGGEIRIDDANKYAHVALVVEGIRLCKWKKAIAYAIVQHAFGIGNTIIYSTVKPNRTGLLLRNILKILNGGNKSVRTTTLMVSAINLCYSDTGLFGCYISAESEVIKQAVISSYEILKIGAITDESFEIGKLQLINEILFNLETDLNLLHEIIGQIQFFGKIKTVPEIIADINSITRDDVALAAKEISDGKFSIVSFGNISNVPYLDEFVQK